MRRTFLEKYWGRIHRLVVEGQTVNISKLRFQLLLMLKTLMDRVPKLYLHEERLDGTMKFMRSLLPSLRRGPDDDQLAEEEPALFMELELRKGIVKDLSNSRCMALELWDYLVSASINRRDEAGYNFVAFTLQLANEHVFSQEREDCEVGLQLMSILASCVQEDERFEHMAQPIYGSLIQLLATDAPWVVLRTLDVLTRCEPPLNAD
jgi:hypothetical protein